MRTIEPNHAGVYDITDLPRSRPMRSPVEPDPLAPPTVRIPRFRFTTDEVFTMTGDDPGRQLLIDQMMAGQMTSNASVFRITIN